MRAGEDSRVSSLADGDRRASSSQSKRDPAVHDVRRSRKAEDTSLRFERLIYSAFCLDLECNTELENDWDAARQSAVQNLLIAPYVILFQIWFW